MAAFHAWVTQLLGNLHGTYDRPTPSAPPTPRFPHRLPIIRADGIAHGNHRLTRRLGEVRFQKEGSRTCPGSARNGFQTLELAVEPAPKPPPRTCLKACLVAKSVLPSDRLRGKHFVPRQCFGIADADRALTGKLATRPLEEPEGGKEGGRERPQTMKNAPRSSQTALSESDDTSV